jgi:predicted nucleotidyltransferase
MHSIIQDQREELAEICSRYAVRKLELFGSATTDRFDPAASDLDFLVEFEPGRLQDMADRYLASWRTWRRSSAEK